MSKAVIHLSSFDESLLPAGSPNRDSEDFPLAVSNYLTKDLSSFGGKVRIVVGPEFIEIDWEPSEYDLVDSCVALLNQGKYQEAVIILRSMREKQPNDPEVLYNLGMALSDLGKLDEAIDCLEHLTKVQPHKANGFVALGVAYARDERTESSLEPLRTACRLEPNNGHAHRNLGGILMKLGEKTEALKHLRQSAEIDGSDPRVWYGLGEAYLLADNRTEADTCFRKVIMLAGSSDIGEAAKRQMTKMAQETLREKSVGGNRPDAMMYCLSALELFQTMDDSQIKKILFELAMKGDRGFDINNPDTRYQFDSLDGDFSGLRAVCYMYTAGQRILPGQDMGIDLSKEYAQAFSMLRQ